jgi:hypothetical protein
MPIRPNATLISWFPMSVAFAAAVGYTMVGSDFARRQAAGIFGLSLGFALLTLDYQALRHERLRSRRVYVQRAESPVVFYALLLGTRIAPGLFMIGAAVWILYFKEA